MTFCWRYEMCTIVRFDEGEVGTKRDVEFSVFFFSLTKSVFFSVAVLLALKLSCAHTHTPSKPTTYAQWDTEKKQQTNVKVLLWWGYLCNVCCREWSSPPRSASKRTLCKARTRYCWRGAGPENSNPVYRHTAVCNGVNGFVLSSACCFFCYRL